MVAKSSTEAELIALADSSSAIIVARRILGEIGALPAGPTTVFEDNMAAITVLRDIVYNGRTKHIDVRLKDIRDQVRKLVVELQYIDTKDQLADLFTKGLPREGHDRLTRRIVNSAPSNPTAREE